MEYAPEPACDAGSLKISATRFREITAACTATAPQTAAHLRIGPPQ
jgi:hypothetical protein